MGTKKNKIKVKITLTKATQKDVLEFDGWNGKIRKYILRYGFPYWLMGTDKKIGNKLYFINKDTDAKQLGEYVKNEQIYKADHLWKE